MPPFHILKYHRQSQTCLKDVCDMLRSKSLSAFLMENQCCILFFNTQMYVLKTSNKTQVKCRILTLYLV